MKKITILALALALVAATAMATWPGASLALAGDLHFDLRTSSPMADSTVVPPSEVRLWFTQEPQSGATAIRILRGDDRVPSSQVIAHPEDSTSYAVTFEEPLSPGGYTVMWRSMAADGHVVDGDFEFTVAAAPLAGGAGRAETDRMPGATP